MLSSSTPFPQAGSRGFFREAPNSILPCRVIQHRPDGTVLIGIESAYRQASSNRAVPLHDLAATAEAFAPARRKVRA